MLGQQTAACPPAQAALLAGGHFVIWEGSAPARHLAATYRRRLRLTERRGQETLALDTTVEILEAAGDLPIQLGRIEDHEGPWIFILFLTPVPETVLACTAVRRPDREPQSPA